MMQQTPYQEQFDQNLVNVNKEALDDPSAHARDAACRAVKIAEGIANLGHGKEPGEDEKTARMIYDTNKQQLEAISALFNLGLKLPPFPTDSNATQ